MIRTVIEVSGEDKGDFKRKLEAALCHLGFEPKADEELVRFRSDLAAALQKKGLSAWGLVEEYRSNFKDSNE